MPTEYWLQKKAFNNWSHVTWYATEEEVIQNFNRVAVEGNGYSWRWVKVEVGGEYILSGERPVMKQEEEYKEAVAKVWSTPENKVKAKETWNNNDWTGYNGGEAVLATKDHGMIGKVWLGNPTTKEKKRVDPTMVDVMMAGGWVKAGPRTVL